MEDQELIVPSEKLNILQRIRKNMMLRSMNSSNLSRRRKAYEKAPEYLKHDVELIKAMLEKDPHYIKELDDVGKTIAERKAPETFVKMGMGDLIEFLKEVPSAFAPAYNAYRDAGGGEGYLIKEFPEYIMMINPDEIPHIVKNENNCIQYLSEDLQMKLLTEVNPPVKELGLGFSLEVKPGDFKDKLSYFSEGVIYKSVAKLIDMARAEKGENWKEQKNLVPLLSEMKIGNLPADVQLKLSILDSDFVEKFSKEARERYFDGNPLLINVLGLESKYELVKKDPIYFNFLSSKDLKYLLAKDPSLEKNIPSNMLLDFGETSASFNRRIENPEIIKNILVKHSIMHSYAYPIRKIALDYLLKNQEFLLETVRFEPEVLLLDEKTNPEIRRQILNLYKSQTDSIKIHDALEKYEPEKCFEWADHKKRREMMNMGKILLNENVVERVDPELIAKFISSQDMNDFKEIVGAAYGEQAKKVLDDRPNISIDQISNLDIFDPIVFEKFGESKIHDMLSYYSWTSTVIGDLVRHPEKIEKFEMFSDKMGDYFQDTPYGFEKRLRSFKRFEEILEEIGPEGLTSERIKEMKNYINDTDMQKKVELFQINSVEDLDTYTQKRNYAYENYIKKRESPIELKEAICQRFFGIPYRKTYGEYSQAKISAMAMISYYSLEDFVSDERTIESKQFSTEELDTLELLTIIDKIKDKDILKDIYEKMKEKENEIVSLSDFSLLREKIPMQYSSELISSLSQIEEIKEKAAIGEEGISLEQTADGLDIIKLNGADFRFMMHSLGLNNSGLLLPGKMGKEIWTDFEEGCSTISASVIEPEMLYSCAREGTINLGFSTVPAKQILAMSHTDAHVDHKPRRIDPIFGLDAVKFNYHDELMRKTAAQITRQEEKDLSHEYNEVTMHRNLIERDENTRSSASGRVMPDSIIVYGTEVSEAARKTAKDFGKDGNPLPIILIDVNGYGDKTYERGARKEDHKVKREKGKIIKDLEER